MNQRTLVSIVESLNGQSIHQMEVRKVRETLKKRFKINGLYDLEPRDVIEIDRKKDATNMLLNYEVREHMFANVDVVLVFNDEFSFR